MQISGVKKLGEKMKYYKYLKNKNIVITDYGVSAMWKRYFINALNYEADEEIPETITFKTKKELTEYLKKYGIVEGDIDEKC